MRTIRMLSVLMLAGFVLFPAVPANAQNGRIAKKAAKEATKDAAGDAAKDATKDVAAGAVKKAAAPDAVDLNTASAEQMTKLGLDEATQQKVVAGRPYSGLDDAKLKEAVPASTLSKLEGRVTVKPKEK
jgi:DNA uptake protein ComE-like DNA-binding protein